MKMMSVATPFAILSTSTGDRRYPGRSFHLKHYLRLFAVLCVFCVPSWRSPVRHEPLSLGVRKKKENAKNAK
ncbi:MAG: hypothetical protein ABSA58_26260, partial [Acetobacteraceae bacterium]